MSLSHLHLVMNHVPTVGAAAALGLLLLGFVRRNDHLKHVGLELLFVIALLTLPVYVSGVGALYELRERPDISVDAMRIHQDAALAGFVVAELAGFIAWIALWQWRRRGRPAQGLVVSATVLLVVSLAIMGRAANLGGEIHHEEIRAAGESVPAESPIQNDSSRRRSATWRSTAAGSGRRRRRCTSWGCLSHSVCCWP